MMAGPRVQENYATEGKTGQTAPDRKNSLAVKTHGRPAKWSCAVGEKYINGGGENRILNDRRLIAGGLSQRGLEMRGGGLSLTLGSLRI